MNTEQLIEYLALGEKDANDLLNELNPKLKSRFQRALTTLEKIVDEVREVYPDANYYVNDDQVTLVLGHAHSSRSGVQPTSNLELVADCARNGKLIGKIGGGGW